jgi:hypothetical protein
MVTMLRPRNLIQPAVRYPADPRALFILVLSVFSGVTTILLEQGPETLESLMPRWAVIVWGVTLGLGSLLALIGLELDSDWGVIVEQVGCVCVGVACVFYSIVAGFILGVGATPVIAIVLGWGLACFVRWLQLQLLIHEHIIRRQLSRLQQQVDDGPESSQA